jgi:hypothetical protein
LAGGGLPGGVMKESKNTFFEFLFLFFKFKGEEDFNGGFDVFNDDECVYVLQLITLFF